MAQNLQLDLQNLLNARNIDPWEFGRIIHDENTAIEALYEWGLIPRTVNCPDCGNEMLEEDRSRSKLKYVWRCRKQGHSNRVFPTSGTLFHGRQISFYKSIKLLIHFFDNKGVSAAAKQVPVQPKTAIKFFNDLREAMRITNLHDFRKIGGRNDIVEMDETRLFSRKNHRGRCIQRPFWVFGGVDRRSKKIFVQPIANKLRTTLDPIITTHVRRRSYIMTDHMKSYAGCSRRLGMRGHARVNHRRSFVAGTRDIFGDPQLGERPAGMAAGLVRVSVHTNSIERHWGLLKDELRHFRQYDQAGNYIGAFLYKRNILRPHDEQGDQGGKFRRFISDVIRVYPGFGRTPIQESVRDCQCADCIPAQ